MAGWVYLVLLTALTRITCDTTLFDVENATYRKGTFLVSRTVSNERSQCTLPESWELLVKDMILTPGKMCDTFRVLRCYCLTLGPSDSLLVFGKCFYGCLLAMPPDVYYQVNISVVNRSCIPFNRIGAFCGQCIEGHGTPAYSFSLKCVPCADGSLWTNILIYVLVAYGPLTIFLAVIVIFTISINSAPLRGFILVCQIISSNIVMRTLINIDEEYQHKSYIYPHVQIFGSVYGVWNLDFFRSWYSSLCLHSSLSTVDVMALDYIVAVYPLLLIVTMYAVVELYSRNIWPMGLVCRLLHHCCVRFRHRLDIRTSLVDAFGTFFGLSYVKFLSTTVNLFTMAKVWRSDTNTTTLYTYFDSTQEPLQGTHFVLLIIGILVTVFCNILPLILMLLYSFPRAQVLLNFFPLSLRQLLFPFMDSILACYKDGTNGTRNCRYFGVVYHLALAFCLCSFVPAKNVFILACNGIASILVGMLVAVAQPYKSKVYNTVDVLLILSVGMGYVGATSFLIADGEASLQTIECAVFLIVPFTLPFIYFAGYIAYKIFFYIRCLLIKCRLKIRLNFTDVQMERHPLLFPSDSLTYASLS